MAVDYQSRVGPEIVGRKIMAVGWAKDGAVQDEIDSMVEEALDRARRHTPTGESLAFCEACDREIPQARREAIAGVRLCVTCQSDREEV
jgi:phage/conjugal plasmid C-4 type zinc finger TraR family protein